MTRVNRQFAARVTPAWLASDFNASRRRALIVAQVIKHGEKLADDAVTMFIKLVGRVFSPAHSRKKRRYINHRTATSKALRLFLDTITALQSVNDQGQDALEVLDPKGRLAPAHNQPRATDDSLLS